MTLVKSSWRPRSQAIALGCCALLAGLLLPLSARAQEEFRRTLAVTGVGEVPVETSITRIRLGVEVRGATAATVQAEVAERTAAVVDLLRSRQVERLQTTGIRLQPDYTYDNNQRRLLGYIGNNDVAFQVPTASAGDVIDAAIRAGASQIDGIEFLATEAALAAAEQVALRAATADARQQADIVLDSLGLSAREVVRIRINDDQPMPRPLLQNAALERVQAGTPVVGGEQLVRATVTLEIQY